MRVLLAFLVALWRRPSSLMASLRHFLSRCSAGALPSPPESAVQSCPEFVALARSLKSVNWHFLRECNYSCGFCYHVNKKAGMARKVLALEEAKRGLRLLVACGMEKINFSGGEPFLDPQRLGLLCRFCKEELRPLDPKKASIYVSIITNGSLVTEKWIKDHCHVVDMIGVSVDSCNDETHREIGRYSETLLRAGRYPGHLEQALLVSKWCHNHGVSFKVNTVVNELNMNDDMTEVIRKLNPTRWKVFELLEIQGENSGEDAVRNAAPLKPSNEAFQNFVARHRSLSSVLVPEDNRTMRDSYVILDEEMRFLDSSTGAKVPSRVSILNNALQLSKLPPLIQGERFGYLHARPELLPVAVAFSEVTFDAQSFKERDGDFYLHLHRESSLTPSSSLPDIESLN